MSMSFWISPLDREAKARLKDARVQPPRRSPPSRGPTPAELMGVIGAWAGYAAGYDPPKPQAGAAWRIDVRPRAKRRSGPGLFIAMSPLKSADAPLPLVRIESGAPELAAVLAVELAKVCGPQLLDGEDVYGPHLVDGRRGPEDLAAALQAYAAREFADAPEEPAG